MSEGTFFHHIIRKKIKTYFLTGLLVLGPLGLTFLVVQWIVGTMDRLIVQFLPDNLQPERIFGFDIPGLGLLVTVLLIFVVGVLTANYFGRALVAFGERIVGHIPLVKGIYTLFKQVADAVFGNDRQGFRRVVLIEYPRRGIYSYGFVTGVASGEAQRLTEKKLINVFVPTTPNPTSGFYILVPEDETIPLVLTVEDAFKLVVSGGMVSAPQDKKAEGERAGNLVN